MGGSGSCSWDTPGNGCGSALLRRPPTLLLVDEFAARVTAPLRHAWADYQAEQKWTDSRAGRDAVLELSRLAEQASSALDNAHAPLLRLLEAAWGELEYIAHTEEGGELLERVRAVLEPITATMDER
jgi:hypothetical protein